jgi:hypothetical protein
MNEVHHELAEAMSSFLTFRYLVREDMRWNEQWKPTAYRLDAELLPVSTANDIDAYLCDYFARHHDPSTGLLLSGGMDSAVLAAYVPKSTRCYTIQYEDTRDGDESERALAYARHLGLRCEVVPVGWRDVEATQATLMKFQKFPLHPVQIAVYKACRQAQADGVGKLITGNGADCTFGGFYKLLGRDWTLEEFVRRFTYVEPSMALRESRSFHDIYARFWDGCRYDTLGFLKHVHSPGVSLSFIRTMECAGVIPMEPFEYLVLEGELDLDRVRRGEEKYLIRELFTRKYGTLAIPRKSPFGRPVDEWFKRWNGPVRGEFRPMAMTALTGDQKWLLYTLEQFLNLMETKHDAI